MVADDDLPHAAFSSVLATFERRGLRDAGSRSGSGTTRSEWRDDRGKRSRFGPRTDGRCRGGGEPRRRQGGGFFLDRGEIDGLAVTCTADLFRGIPGFVVERVGARTVATLARRSACISPLIDGRPASRANLIPSMAADLTALEVYVKPDSLPEILESYSWPTGSVAHRGRCVVVVYWTIASG
jgi:hypothetical protein